ncbi:MAG: PfkB family carbohydrate kinase [Candidatus Latescibacteria bacterium]|jgi:adenosine kinase|nr:PfkB family carbohydrate kinase [Candidatus Latescibacterota bacterium]
MTIAILGTVVYDEIFTYRGVRNESYGGITYNVAALSSLVDESAMICPVANIGEDRANEICSVLGGYKQTDCGHLAVIDQPNTNVKLVYSSISERSEAIWHIPPALTKKTLTDAVGVDAILINFITGQELTLDALVELRSSTSALIHMDVHNRISSWGDDGGRTITGFGGWEEWLAHVDTVQMNEMESEVLLKEEITEIDGFLDAAKRFVEAGLKAAMVTLGPLGSVVAYRADDGVYGCHCPAAVLGDVIDTTGCGDSFSAGFVWNFLSSGDPLLANAAANIVGGVNCITPGIGGLTQAKGALDQLPKIFPELMDRIDGGWPGARLD